MAERSQGRSSRGRTGSLGAKTLAEVTQPALRRQEGIAFAGFLVREDDDAVYIADRKGTWVVPRDEILFLEEWESGNRCVPDALPSEGRPVQVGVRDGATIHEIRPWKMLTPDEGLFQRNLRRSLDAVFTLGGEGPPVGEGTRLGENQLAALERSFARTLGWDPRDPCTNPVAETNTSTATIVCSGGECWWGHSDKD